MLKSIYNNNNIYVGHITSNPAASIATGLHEIRQIYLTGVTLVVTAVNHGKCFNIVITKSCIV